MTCIAPADSKRRGMIRTKDMAQGDVRTRMVKGAAELLATNGVEGTSFAEVLSVTDARGGRSTTTSRAGSPSLSTLPSTWSVLEPWQ